MPASEGVVLRLWLLKWFLHMGVLGSVIPFFAKGGGTNFANIIVLGFLSSALSFLIGDLLILRRLGHKSGIIGDFLVVYTVLWLGPAIIDGIDSGRPYTFEGAVLASAIAALLEFLYHPVLARTFGWRPAGLGR